jgi:hypothetical protein
VRSSRRACAPSRAGRWRSWATAWAACWRAPRSAHCAGDPTAERITRVIGLGTPHGGSIAAVQALRATYPVVCRLAAIDGRHDAEGLSREVFGTFMSVYQLLPADSGGLDLFDPRSWPQRGAGPDAALLAAARGFGAQLAPADARFASIIGTGQRTVTGIERRGGQFHYEISAAGDGTVSALCATLPGAHNYYLRCEHSELPRSELVAGAVVDLLRTGRTRRLPQRVIVGPAAMPTSAMRSCAVASRARSTGMRCAPPSAGATSRG